jgi:glyoxylase-like metal-dependent hydrolase (beta-lactamase superfamily II)
LELSSVLGNAQKLDGGAMFGHVPKSVWSQWVSADQQNRIDLACRGLLIRDGARHILLETGIGAYMAPKLRERFGVVESRHVLLDSLQAIGVAHTDIDVVILSHLHFDHAGGLLAAWEQNEPAKLLFPNATYIFSQKAWERACQPTLRDRASFIPELQPLLTASNRLRLVSEPQCDLLGDRYAFLFSDGHTPGLLHTVIKSPKCTIIFASDLIPGTPWVHLLS